MATPVPAVPIPERPGRTTRPGGLEDRYRSLFVIGRGGMGTVEVALERGSAGFERVVALKRLLPEQSRDPRHKEMFLREARLAALLQHPNVVHAFAFGEIYGELFLAMEYVEGETLSRVMSAIKAAKERDGVRVDPGIVALILAGVCDGLHAAHELRDRGGQLLRVVHRDVSPQNVMIAYEGHVKILDFGVAKFETGGHETRTGEVKGKMAYMSPEQALGEKLDRRSDLFSVGAVLFECLTGQRMWGEGTDLDVMRKLALEEPPRLTDALPDAPGALALLQSRLVAREPEGRPDTARAVADELRAFAAARPGSNEAALKALMHGLFLAQAHRQREMLTGALQQAAPQRVESLRKTLDPTRTFERPTLTEALILRSEPPPATVRASGMERRRRLALLGTAAVVLVALTIGTLALRSRGIAGAEDISAATTPSVATASTTTPPPSAPTTPTATGVPSSPTAAASTPSGPAGATSAAATATPSVPPNVAARPRGAARAAPRPTATTRLPDVDPTPF